MRKVKQVALLLTLLIIAEVGCVKRAGSTVPVTPLEKVMAYNTLLAASNDNVAKGVIQSQQLNLVSQANAVAITTAQVKVAKADQKLTAILNQGIDFSVQNATEIQSLLNEMKSTADDLIRSGAISVTNKDTQNAMVADVNSVSGLASLMVTTLQAAGVLK